MKVHRDMCPESSFFGLFYTVCNDCWPLWLILAHNHPHENLGASFCSASLIPEKCHGMIGNTAPHTQFPQQKSAISSNLCDDHITTALAAFFMLNSLLRITVHPKWKNWVFWHFFFFFSEKNGKKLWYNQTFIANYTKNHTFVLFLEHQVLYTDGIKMIEMAGIGYNVNTSSPPWHLLHMSYFLQYVKRKIKQMTQYKKHWVCILSRYHIQIREKRNSQIK